jgi:riboflavin transporter FmnP
MVKKEVLIGLVIGLIANALGLFLSALILGQGEGFIMVLKAASAEGFLGKLISIGAVLNLIAFFIFIKKKQDYRARGVLLATIFVAVFTFILNFN